MAVACKAILETDRGFKSHRHHIMKKKNYSLLKYLEKIYGVGTYKASKFAAFIGASPNTKFNKLSYQKKDALNKVLAYYKKCRDTNAIYQNLITYQQEQILHKIKINTLAGKRFKLRLPVRGQRTRSNAKTASKR